ncbi:predicted protein [Histoplasma mississippiense (nom. inval.)]|uniref:predicted protein n=1 Tax=Ajellomyces capsulatus (strain NAm1 / WU24) TaxID=2059318 RepID=UPI000157B92C|nr:predicted protein [Histoplasma mississippiense (nom. inval.)]EDN03567.1 predicted protein [Histoplasma mississippiense (nom. inval.)]
MKFINYADQNRILLAVLPPHSTHRLQPLDLAIFGPLAKAYSNELNENIRTGLGLIRTTKRDFWQLFKKAWEIAVIPSNIEIAFAAAGISPFNPERVLAKIVRAAREQAAAAEALKIDSQARRQEAQLQCTILREEKTAETVKWKDERQKACKEAVRQREKAKEAAAVKHQIEKK